MYAMELNGSHVGKTVRIKWRPTKPTHRMYYKNAPARIDEVRITDLRHLPAGDVMLSNHKLHRYPPNAEVEFI